MVCCASSPWCSGLCLADSLSRGADVQEDYDDVSEPEPQAAQTPAGADSALRAPQRELPEVPPDDVEEGDYPEDDDYLEQDPLG